MEPEVPIPTPGDILRSTLLVRAVLALAAAFVLSSTLLTAPTTAAAPERTATVVAARPGCLPNCWVAISFNTDTLRGGWTQNGNWGTKSGASSSALNHCKNRDVNAGHARACVAPGVKDTVTQNGCVAVAWLTRNGNLVRWVKASAYGPRIAERKAKRKLDGTGVRDAGHACSPRDFS
jgi:hypothetical protein